MSQINKSNKDSIIVNLDDDAEKNAGMRWIPELNKEMAMTFNYIKHSSKHPIRRWMVENFYKQMLRDLSDLPINSILDAGCGSGKHAVYFSADGYRVIGIDLSPGMLQQAVENSRGRGVTFEPIIGNIRSPSLPTGGIDGVWSSASLVHLPPIARKETLGQFYRILNHGGMIYIGVQNLLTPKHIKRVGESFFCCLGYDENNKFYRRFKTLTEIAANLPLVDRLKLGYAFLDDRHWFYPTRTELFELLGQAGFSVIESNHCLARRLSIFAIKE